MNLYFLLIKNTNYMLLLLYIVYNFALILDLIQKIDMQKKFSAFLQ